MLIREVPKKALKVTRDEDVHGRTEGFLHTTGINSSSGCRRRSRVNLLVGPRFPEASKDVIRVRRDDELANGETHLFCVVACQDVAEVACGDNILNFGVRVFGKLGSEVEEG